MTTIIPGPFRVESRPARDPSPAARFPFPVTWDDHAVENNYAASVSEDNDIPGCTPVPLSLLPGQSLEQCRRWGRKPRLASAWLSCIAVLPGGRALAGQPDGQRPQSPSG